MKHYHLDQQFFITHNFQKLLLKSLDCDHSERNYQIIKANKQFWVRILFFWQTDDVKLQTSVIWGISIVRECLLEVKEYYSTKIDFSLFILKKNFLGKASIDYFKEQTYLITIIFLLVMLKIQQIVIVRCYSSFVFQVHYCAIFLHFCCILIQIH